MRGSLDRRVSKRRLERSRLQANRGDRTIMQERDQTSGPVIYTDARLETTVVVQRSRSLARETVAFRVAHEVRCALDAGVALARYRLAADASYRQGATSVGHCDVEILVQPSASNRWSVEIRARRNRGAGLPYVATRTVVLECG